LYCVSNYFITLRWIGYSREYLYTTTKKYFDNNKLTIEKCEQINDFLDSFPLEIKKYDFLVLMDVDSIEYIDDISEGKFFGNQISKIDIASERTSLLKDRTATNLLREYDIHAQNPGDHEKLAIVRISYEDYDPFSAAVNFNRAVALLQSFVRYFKHFSYFRQVYRILLKMENGHYREIKLPSKLQKRPYIEQSIIDSRIRNIITFKSMTNSAFMSVAQAIEMHAEAFDSRSTSTLLKTFWTALEMLFSDPNPSNTRDNVINSCLAIIQKTYILKRLRALYTQLVEATKNEELIELGIVDFRSYLIYFSSYTANSSEMKRIYALLSDNPLLRSRLHSIRNTLDNGKSINSMLEKHQQRIEWQLKRLYRIRNIATHLGEELTGTEVAVNHLHNYFDFVVNYILCKSENDDYVVSTSSVVFEAKNDNRIYHEMLKKDETLSKENFIEMLFGPDLHLINYQFEH